MDRIHVFHSWTMPGRIILTSAGFLVKESSSIFSKNFNYTASRCSITDLKRLNLNSEELGNSGITVENLNVQEMQEFAAIGFSWYWFLKFDEPPSRQQNKATKLYSK